jgi:hypothetical protein
MLILLMFLILLFDAGPSSEERKGGAGDLLDERGRRRTDHPIVVRGMELRGIGIHGRKRMPVRPTLLVHIRIILGGREEGRRHRNMHTRGGILSTNWRCVHGTEVVRDLDDRRAMTGGSIGAE